VPLRCTPYKTGSAGAAIYINDLMKEDTNGVVLPAAVANNIWGSSADYNAASTTLASLGVFDDPQQEFIAQDDASATLGQVGLGTNYDITVTTGNTTTLISTQEIAASIPSADSGNVRLIRLLNTPGNALGDNADWICMINEHAYKATAGI